MILRLAQYPYRWWCPEELVFFILINLTQSFDHFTY